MLFDYLNNELHLKNLEYLDFFGEGGNLFNFHIF